MRRILALLQDSVVHTFRSGFERELVSRPQFDDHDFYETWYGGSGIPEDIPIRVRMVCVEQFGDCCTFCTGRHTDFAVTPLSLTIAVQDHLSESRLRSIRPKRAANCPKVATRSNRHGTCYFSLNLMY